MKKSLGYRVNHVDGVIVITKGFGKSASIAGTNEYDTLRTLRNENPGYTVKYRDIKSNKSKKTHKGLNFSQMEIYIRKLPDSKQLLAEFEHAKAYFKDTPAYSAKVRKWFFSKEVLKQFYETDDTTTHGDAA